jgi:hypothetical protein
MGRGDRRKVRWARDRQRKKKARLKVEAAEKAPPRRRRASSAS